MKELLSASGNSAPTSSGHSEEGIRMLRILTSIYPAVVSDIYREEDFYSDGYRPTEEYRYSRYRLDENGDNYNQFILVVNAEYPYIRLSRAKGKSQYPCGGETSVPEGGWFSRLSDAEREKHCPKIAWGFVAEYLMNLRYDGNQDDYVELQSRDTVIRGYYCKYLKIYLDNHNGLKYSSVSLEQKELDFLAEHEKLITALWAKTTPLKAYPSLYEYASLAERDYEMFLQRRKNEIQNAEKHGKEEDNRDRTVIQNGAKSIYIENNMGSVIINHESLGMTGHNEAYFADIEKKILAALDDALATIDVCVAWFTNHRLRDKLLEKQGQGIEVRVIIYKDGVNSRKGVNLTGLKHKEYRGERGGVLHDKFCVIDNVTTISGSYNWTENAENKNDEDASFRTKDYEFASEFTKRFNQMWHRDDKNAQQIENGDKK